MKEITLCNTGRKACVDGEPGEEFDHLSRFVWNESKQGYARAWIGGKWVHMHAMIAKPGGGMCVDHIDRNKLNNRKANLRVCSHRINNLNRVRCREFGPQLPDGVTYNKKQRKFVAQIQRGELRLFLGVHSNINDAAEAYQGAARKLYPEDFK